MTTEDGNRIRPGQRVWRHWNHAQAIEQIKHNYNMESDQMDIRKH